jgi:hypothetical protein
MQHSARRLLALEKQIQASRAEASRIELVLYVSASSPPSVRAVANLRRILGQYKSDQIKYSICDLRTSPEEGALDQIAFTPTLCKRQPEPPMWILGDLAHPEPLVELLEFYGVEPSDGHRKAHDRHQRI